jgi:hypothetical protein
LTDGAWNAQSTGLVEPLEAGMFPALQEGHDRIIQSGALFLRNSTPGFIEKKGGHNKY